MKAYPKSVLLRYLEIRHPNLKVKYYEQHKDVIDFFEAWLARTRVQWEKLQFRKEHEQWQRANQKS